MTLASDFFVCHTYKSRNFCTGEMDLGGRITSIQPRGHDEMQTDKPTFCENLVGIILCYNTDNNTDNYHN
jgi:hypothetical protein